MLAVLSLAPHLHGKRAWNCLCDCGKTSVVDTGKLTSGNTKSCGCNQHPGNSRTHGMAETATWNTWRNMRQRCENPKVPSYADYGARGISVCPEWGDFQTFLSDMGERPSKSHSLDRIDNSRGYSKENCRWATRKEQTRNKRNNVLITFNGETRVMTDWDAHMGWKPWTVGNRLSKGWTIEEALSIPLGPPRGRRGNKSEPLYRG